MIDAKSLKLLLENLPSLAAAGVTSLELCEGMVKVQMTPKPPQPASTHQDYWYARQAEGEGGQAEIRDMAELLEGGRVITDKGWHPCFALACQNNVPPGAIYCPRCREIVESGQGQVALIPPKQENQGGLTSQEQPEHNIPTKQNQGQESPQPDSDPGAEANGQPEQTGADIDLDTAHL